MTCTCGHRDRTWMIHETARLCWAWYADVRYELVNESRAGLQWRQRR